jgi:hypothetical protein
VVRAKRDALLVLLDVFAAVGDRIEATPEERDAAAKRDAERAAAKKMALVSRWGKKNTATIVDAANAYGIPVPLLNDLSHATLANAREYERILWTHSLVPDARLRAEEIVEQFLPRFRTRTTWAEFDFSGVAALQESETEQWTREAEQIRVGGFTINEWRKKHGLPPVPWGDVWWAPVNQSPVTSSDSAPQGDTSPSTVPAATANALRSALELAPFHPRPAVLNGAH